MSFDTRQAAYCDFREIVTQHTNQTLVWGGAGLSAPAGLPSWPKLRGDLVALARNKARTLGESGAKVVNGLTDAAEEGKNL